MKIVLDANVIIAALLGSRATLVILTSQNHSFFVPQKILEEIKKHQSFICTYGQQSPEEFTANLDALLFFIDVVDFVVYEPFLQQAQATLSRDVEDADYLACALAVHADFLWTNDKDFSTQDLVPIKTTEQFIDEGKL